jgi:hypothetical protein
MTEKFKQLMREYGELRDSGRDDTEEARLLFIEMMECAPDECLDTAHEIAVDMGLMPEKPDGYSDDGQALYSLDGIAKRIGVDVADIDERFKELAHVGPFHRAH